VVAATGVKIAGPGMEDALAGSPIIAYVGDEDKAVEEVMEASQPKIEMADQGLTVLADAVGSLEGLAFELKEAGIPITRAEIRNVSRKDVVEVSTNPEPLFRVIVAFNVDILPDAEEELNKGEVKLISGAVVYKLVEDYQEWAEERKEQLDAERRTDYIHPGKFLILPDHVFRVSKPAIVGVRVLAGRLRVGQPILRPDGRELGKIKSIRSGDETLKEVRQGAPRSQSDARSGSRTCSTWTCPRVTPGPCCAWTWPPTTRWCWRRRWTSRGRRTPSGPCEGLLRGVQTVIISCTGERSLI
jgi:translation initiation factor 5B